MLVIASRLKPEVERQDHSTDGKNKPANNQTDDDVHFVSFRIGDG